MSGFTEVSHESFEREIEYDNEEFEPRKKLKNSRDGPIDACQSSSSCLLVDIEELLKDYYKWKSIFDSLEDKNHKLNEELTQYQKQLEKAKSKKQHLDHENSQLKEIIFNQQMNIKSLSLIEEENLKLNEKITTVKETVTALRAVQSQEKNSHLEELNKVETSYQKKLHEQKISSLESREKTAEKFKQQLFLKEKEIESIHKHYSEVEKEYKDKLQKSTIDYEEKLLKLQEQILKSNKVSGSISSTMTSDIFRKKMSHMQSEYESKIALLNQTINKLREKLRVSYVPESPKRRILSLSDRKNDDDDFCT